MISRLLPFLSFPLEPSMTKPAQAPCGGCDKCRPTAPCGHLSIDDDFPFESDKSALGTQQEKWLNSPSTFLDRLCSAEPGAVECKTYED